MSVYVTWYPLATSYIFFCAGQTSHIFLGLNISPRSIVSGHVVRAERSFRIRHRNQLTVKAWEKAVQELGKYFPAFATRYTFSRAWQRLVASRFLRVLSGSLRKLRLLRLAVITAAVGECRSPNFQEIKTYLSCTGHRLHKPLTSLFCVVFFCLTFYQSLLKTREGF